MKTLLASCLLSLTAVAQTYTVSNFGAACSGAIHGQVVQAPAGTGLRANALSCVLRVDNGRHSALLVGDIEAAQETRLVEVQARLKADLLLMPHHGSKTSSTPAFLDAVQPRLALAQAGYRNRFGHPAPAVLARYRERGIEVVESARCGAATWTSARPQAVSCQRETARRYWHHAVP